MSQYRSRNRAICVKIEVTPGTDPVPTVAANAVLVASPSSSPNLNSFETDEVTGSLDDRASIPSTGSRSFRCKVWNKGSGTSGTVLPEFDPLLKIAGLGVQALAADVTGTAQAGAAGSITLAAGASAVTNFYRGMVIEITGGTGIGQRRLITAYNGATKVASVQPNWTVTTDATSVYAIRKCHVYRPISASLPNATIYEYLHRSDGGNSKLKATVGAAAAAQFTMEVGTGCYWDFNCLGQLVQQTDPANPGPATYQGTTALRTIAFQAADVSLGNTAINLRQLNFDFGADVQQIDTVSATFGLGVAGIVRRRMGGTMSLPEDLESVRNVMTSWQAGTPYSLGAVWGSVSGNRFGVLIDNLVYTGLQDEDVRGFGYNNTPFRINAADDGFSICYW